MTAAPGWEGILHDGEEILWQGRPDPSFRLSAGRIIEAVFGTFFAGFAVFWMIMAASGPGGFWMFGLIHFSVGVGLVLHALFWPTFRRRHTWYTLSTERAFVATNLPIRGKALKSYAITAETPIRHEDGHPGSIWFAHEYRKTKRGSRRVDIGFERIAAARDVLQLITGIQRSAHAGTK